MLAQPSVTNRMAKDRTHEIAKLGLGNEKC